jgi:hypothetical protein
VCGACVRSSDLCVSIHASTRPTLSHTLDARSCTPYTHSHTLTHALCTLASTHQTLTCLCGVCACVCVIGGSVMFISMIRDTFGPVSRDRTREHLHPKAAKKIHPHTRPSRHVIRSTDGARHRGRCFDQNSSFDQISAVSIKSVACNRSVGCVCVGAAALAGLMSVRGDVLECSMVCRCVGACVGCVCGGARGVAERERGVVRVWGV